MPQSLAAALHTLVRSSHTPRDLERLLSRASCLPRRRPSCAALPGVGDHSALWVFCASGIERAVEFSQRTLGTDIRMRISGHLLGLYFQTRAYYRQWMSSAAARRPHVHLTDR